MVAFGGWTSIPNQHLLDGALGIDLLWAPIRVILASVPYLWAAHQRQTSGSPIAFFYVILFVKVNATSLLLC
jgi:hypothetical protein